MKAEKVLVYDLTIEEERDIGGLDQGECNENGKIQSNFRYN